MPKDYDTALRGATVALTFTLKHYAVDSRGTPGPSTDTYVADVFKIRVLAPPPPRAQQAAPRKRLLKRVDDDFGSKRKVARTG